MEEIIMEILVRLPVKYLLRFKSVCKAWQAIINDPIFIRAHLRHSAAKWEHNQCFIISPHSLDVVIPGERWPSTFSNHLLFYQWQLQHGTSPNNSNPHLTFLDAKENFFHHFNFLRYFTHCDGLVFASTNTGLYLFNPATRDAVTLPDSHRNNLRALGRSKCYCAGLGLDPRTGKYKVVQAFYRSLDPDTGVGMDMGMEVYTVGGGGGWREIANDPPYPARRVQTALAVSGFMFWRLANPHLEQEMCGILLLSLDDEEFDIAGLPYDLNPEDEFFLDVLHGRDLCLTACNSSQTILNIWVLPIADEGLYTMWEWRYAIKFEGLCHTMVLPPFSKNEIILWQGGTVYCYELATSEVKTVCELREMRYHLAREWETLFNFDLMFFTESLVQIA